MQMMQLKLLYLEGCSGELGWELEIMSGELGWEFAISSGELGWELAIRVRSASATALSNSGSSWKKSGDEWLSSWEGWTTTWLISSSSLSSCSESSSFSSSAKSSASPSSCWFSSWRSLSSPASSRSSSTVVPCEQTWVTMSSSTTVWSNRGPAAAKQGRERTNISVGWWNLLRSYFKSKKTIMPTGL